MSKGKIIILGTAHLITTPGKRSPNGLFREYEYSRTIVRELSDILKGYGYTVLIDYINDNPNEQMKAMTPKGEQSKELLYRTNYVNDICNEYGKDNVLYVSVHCNASPPNDGEWHVARGWSVYTSIGDTNADKLASCLAKRAKSNIESVHKHYVRTDMSDGDDDFEANFYILKNTKCPAVITENLFMDNREDVTYLTSEEGRHAIIRLHLEGIIDYINEFE